MKIAPSRRVELTEREQQVLQRLAVGHTDAEIGRQLSISVFTVRNHVKSIQLAQDARNRTQAGAIYHQQSS